MTRRSSLCYEGMVRLNRGAALRELQELWLSGPLSASLYPEIITLPSQKSDRLVPCCVKSSCFSLIFDHDVLPLRGDLCAIYMSYSHRSCTDHYVSRCRGLGADRDDPRLLLASRSEFYSPNSTLKSRRRPTFSNKRPPKGITGNGPLLVLGWLVFGVRR